MSTVIPKCLPSTKNPARLASHLIFFWSAMTEGACEKLFKQTEILRNGCIISYRTPSNKRPTIRHKKSMKLLTHVILEHKRQFQLKPWYQASHICGMARCINPAHLIWESESKNVSRNKCHKWQHFDRCKHQPHCIKFHKDLYEHTKRETNKRYINGQRSKLLTIVQNNKCLD